MLGNLTLWLKLGATAVVLAVVAFFEWKVYAAGEHARDTYWHGVIAVRDQKDARALQAQLQANQKAADEQAAAAALHAAQDKEVVAGYEKRIADSGAHADDLARRLLAAEIAASHQGGCSAVPASGKAGTTAGAPDAGGDRDPGGTGLEQATAALIDACTVTAARLTALQQWVLDVSKTPPQNGDKNR